MLVDWLGCWGVCTLRRTTQEAADLAREVKQLAVGGAAAPALAPAASDSAASSSSAEASAVSTLGAGLPLTPVATRPADKSKGVEQAGTATPQATLPAAATPGTGAGGAAWHCLYYLVDRDG